ncbi:GvpL/GvpF family gas vesicle protein [Salimicrobium salexigens]|uniref:Gas vesicle synthesis protein GvpL/GvpF n=1 Tax=Salimicrobium salexigens TaxID=908941 RepID=A0ABY1KRP3_9BACI|nr:GvpL/GvpF family gas vesicle protein [Salimicrobium salexigens]SIS69502.1 Gas vesicle synthesis protein GvpL/GvpF [Salimicrobium salexigens]
MGKLVYLYGIIPEGHEIGEIWDSEKSAIEGESLPYIEDFGGLAAVVTDVSEEEFGETAMEENSNNTAWIQEKAFHHHEALLELQRHTTVLPMKFGTIFESVESLKQMIDEKEDHLQHTLQTLEGKEEWNVKAYINPKTFYERVAEANENVKAKREEIEQMSKGRQYLEKKKLDKFIEEEMFKDQEKKAEEMHDRLAGYSEDSERKKNWKKDVTGREDEMALNSAFLVVSEDLESFLDQIRDMEKEKEEDGWLIEATGPWPAYHFATMEE